MSCLRVRKQLMLWYLQFSWHVSFSCISLWFFCELTASAHMHSYDYKGFQCHIKHQQSTWLLQSNFLFIKCCLLTTKQYWTIQCYSALHDSVAVNVASSLTVTAVDNWLIKTWSVSQFGSNSLRKVQQYVIIASIVCRLYMKLSFIANKEELHISSE